MAAEGESVTKTLCESCGKNATNKSVTCVNCEKFFHERCAKSKLRNLNKLTEFTILCDNCEVLK